MRETTHIIFGQKTAVLEGKTSTCKDIYSSKENEIRFKEILLLKIDCLIKIEYRITSRKSREINAVF